MNECITNFKKDRRISLESFIYNIVNNNTLVPFQRTTWKRKRRKKRYEQSIEQTAPRKGAENEAYECIPTFGREELKGTGHFIYISLHYVSLSFLL